MSLHAALAAVTITLAIAGAGLGALAIAGILPRGFEFFWGLLALANLANAASDAMQGDPADAAFFTVQAAFWGWLWWRENRRGRRKRKAATSLSDVARKRIGAMVRSMRERPLGRPVLQPATGAA